MLTSWCLLLELQIAVVLLLQFAPRPTNSLRQQATWCSVAHPMHSKPIMSWSDCNLTPGVLSAGEGSPPPMNPHYKQDTWNHVEVQFLSAKHTLVCCRGVSSPLTMLLCQIYCCDSWLIRWWCPEAFAFLLGFLFLGPCADLPLWPLWLATSWHLACNSECACCLVSCTIRRSCSPWLHSERFRSNKTSQDGIEMDSGSHIRLSVGLWSPSLRAPGFQFGFQANAAKCINRLALKNNQGS